MPARRRGFTLVEAMLAVAIVVLISAALFAALHATHRAADTRDARQAGPAAALEALRGVATDLASAYDPMDSNNPMDLRQGEDSTRTGGPPFRLSFKASLRPPDAADPRDFEIVDLRYECRVVEPGVTNLVRIARPAAGQPPDAPFSTGVLIRSSAAAAAQVWDGTNWASAWPPGAQARLPRGAKVTLWLPHGDGTWSGSVAVAIAAGTVIRPSQTNPPGRVTGAGP